jgi:hypothetical protein
LRSQCTSIRGQKYRCYQQYSFVILTVATIGVALDPDFDQHHHARAVILAPWALAACSAMTMLEDDINLRKGSRDIRVMDVSAVL